MKKRDRIPHKSGAKSSVPQVQIEPPSIGPRECAIGIILRMTPEQNTALVLISEWVGISPQDYCREATESLMRGNLDDIWSIAHTPEHPESPKAKRILPQLEAALGSVMPVDKATNKSTVPAQPKFRFRLDLPAVEIFKVADSLGENSVMWGEFAELSADYAKELRQPGPYASLNYMPHWHAAAMLLTKTQRQRLASIYARWAVELTAQAASVEGGAR